MDDCLEGCACREYERLDRGLRLDGAGCGPREKARALSGTLWTLRAVETRTPKSSMEKGEDEGGRELRWGDMVGGSQGRGRER